MREDRRCLFMSSLLDCSVLKPYFSLSVSRLSNSKVLLVDKTVEIFWEMKFNGLSGVFRLEAC